MRSLQLFLFAVALVVPAISVPAEPVSVHNLRLWQAPDHTRLVFDLTRPLEHRLSTQRSTDQILVELDNARLQDGLAQIDVGNTYIAAVRATESNGQLRISLDLRRPVRAQSFLLKPYGQYGHRLVIDLYDEAVTESTPEPEPRAAPPARTVLKPKPLVVAIDAGHGGEDPGAIGRRYRTYEKHVVLAIARELQKRVAADPGMKAVMIRDGDYYIGLRERIRKAQRHDADVFISIHADSVAGRQARGSSVYALSLRGATSEQARVLADKENAADMVGGADLGDLDDVTFKVLVDMMQSATIGDSLGLGADVLGSMRAIGPLHTSHVQQAGFMVLKSPRFPSILVETAFISNPNEEKRLRDPRFQRQMADSIYKGLKKAAPRLIARRGTGGEVVQASAPAPAAGAASRPATVASPHAPAVEHVVKPGETLFAIARMYDIHVDALRFLNDLRDNDLPAGLKLRIPSRPGGG